MGRWWLWWLWLWLPRWQSKKKRDERKLRDDINEIHTHDKMVPTERRSGIEREGKLNKGVRWSREMSQPEKTIREKCNETGKEKVKCTDGNALVTPSHFLVRSLQVIKRRRWEGNPSLFHSWAKERRFRCESLQWKEKGKEHQAWKDWMFFSSLLKGKGNDYKTQKMKESNIERERDVREGKDVRDREGWKSGRRSFMEKGPISLLSFPLLWMLSYIYFLGEKNEETVHHWWRSNDLNTLPCQDEGGNIRRKEKDFYSVLSVLLRVMHVFVWENRTEQNRRSLFCSLNIL